MCYYILKVIHMNNSEFNIIRNLRIKTARKSIGCISRCFLLIIFGSIALSFSCEREDMFTFAEHRLENRLEIGDTGPGGGIVFYVTDGGLHGLEAAPYGWYGVTFDPSPVWSTVPSAFANGSTPLSASVGSGAANTAVMLAQDSVGPNAATYCRDYSGGGKKDWFLPSKDELHLMYTNLKLSGLGGFGTAGYWSSSEETADPTVAWDENFTGGTQYTYTKNNNSYVRPVRAF